MEEVPRVMSIWPEDRAEGLGAEAVTLTRFAAASPGRGGDFLVLPGGGYNRHAPHEGEGYARWLAGLGITAHVLTYRLGSAGHRHPAMLHDAARALRLIRSQARAEGRDPARVGVIGSSAGGHLAATLLTRWTDAPAQAGDAAEVESSRPDLGVLCYPVISFVEHAHEGSRLSLLGPEAGRAQWLALSAERQVTPATPPCWIWHTWEDEPVPVENALLFAGALRRAGVPFELHVYERGRHGLGLGRDGLVPPPWDAECARWLRERRFLR